MTVGAALAMMLAGCQSGSSARRAMYLEVGGTGHVTLPATEGTGYDWLIDRASSEGLGHIRVGEPVSQSKGGQRVGGLREVTWPIEGASVGTALLQFEYCRPWEAGVAPAKTVRYEVMIR